MWVFTVFLKISSFSYDPFFKRLGLGLTIVTSHSTVAFRFSKAISSSHQFCPIKTALRAGYVKPVPSTFSLAGIMRCDLRNSPLLELQSPVMLELREGLLLEDWGGHL